VAAAAQARRAEVAPRRQEQPERVPARPAARRAPQARRRAAPRARLTRLFVVFVVCLTVLAVGRVSLSFAVVQKTLQTEAVVREERALSAENAQLGEKLAQMSSSGRISHIARTQLGLVEADGWLTLRVTKGASVAKVALRP
jgi:cell division protein FtsL